MLAREYLALVAREEVAVVASSSVGLGEQTTAIDLAGAWLLDPSIADRLTVVWIGGTEHPGVERAPGAPSTTRRSTLCLPRW